MKRHGPSAFAVVLGLLLLAGLIGAVRGHLQRSEVDEIHRLRARRAALRDSLNLFVARDPILARAREDTAGIAVALSEKLIVALAQEAARHYLDRVEIDLDDVEGHGVGQYDVKTPLLGKRRLGEWKVEATVDTLRGVITALTPDVEVTGNDRVHLAVPMEIQERPGSVTLDFSWDSKSVFNVVCRDWHSRQTLRGRLRTQQHVVRGDLVFSATPEGILADPDFPPERFPLSMELDSASWDRVREALEEQNKLLKCGLLVHPDEIVAKLHVLGIQGLGFKIPRATFRSFVIPATILQSVRILNSPVDLAVTPHELKITPDMLWYAADVSAKKARGPAPLLPIPAPAK
jgi:hypothetical protein